MKSLAKNIDHYPFTDNDRLFCDTNVLLYVFAPSLERLDPSAEKYSPYLDNALKMKSKIFTDVVVITELAHAYARRKWMYLYPTNPRTKGLTKHCKLFNKPKKFDSFLISEEFRPIATALTVVIKRIMERCIMLDGGLSNAQLGNVLTAYPQGGIQFNDLIISELCHKNNLTLVTHDRGFKKHHNGLILTANKRLL